MTSKRLPAAGDVLLSPVLLCALLLLVINDHLLKTAWPGWWTGKLSDFAGALFFPLFIQASGELSLRAVGRFKEPSRTLLFGGIGITAILFLATELSSFGVALVTNVASLAEPMFRGSPQLTRDLSDLLALVMLFFAYQIGMARVSDRGRRIDSRGPHLVHIAARKGVLERETATNEYLV